MKRDPAVKVAAFSINKASEVADLSSNWVLRERAFAIEHLRSVSAAAPLAITMGAEDVQAISGVIGRFPAFRQWGLELLRRSSRIWRKR